MYRNIYFDYKTSNIILYTWDPIQGRIKEEHPFKPHLFVEDKNGIDGVSIYNTPLTRVDFKTNKKRKEFAQHTEKTFFNLKPERQFLIEKYKGQNKTDSFSYYPLKIFYIDLEVDARNGFPNPVHAKDPINLITVYDTLTDCYHTFGLKKPYYSHEDNVIYKYYETETELIKAFLRFWRKDFPDIVTGWNTDAFDIPYLCNRINHIYDDETACERLSPVGNVFKQENVTRNHGPHKDHYDQLWYITGVTSIDYFACYRTFTRETREGYSLDVIACEELGSGKLHQNAMSLTDLADNNWYAFVDYNIQDVRLVLQLEEKLHYLDTCRKLSYLGLCPLSDGMGTVAIVTGVAAQKALEQNKYIPTLEPSEREDFTGGYVKDPQLGIQKSLLYYDANSLYPNTLVTLNISPETKLGKVEHIENGNKKVTTIKGSVYELTPDKYESFLNAQQIAVSEANILFSQKQRGIFSQIIEQIYAERVAIKKQLKEVDKKKSLLVKGTPEYDQLDRESTELDLKQYTIKIFLNRIYGYFGEASSPMYDIEIASSVTMTGQSCIKVASELCNNYIKNTYDLDYDCVVMNDTDSVVLKVDPILTKLGQTFDVNGSINPLMYQLGKDFKVILDTGIQKWARETMRSKHCTYEFKQENITQVGVFVKKKHYILYIRDKEGILTTEDDNFKYSGIQVVKTSTPKKVKPLVKQILKSAIQKSDKKEVEQLLKDAYEVYQTFTPEEIGIPISLNNYEKYKSRCDGFNIALRTPYQVKGAIYHNLLIDKFCLEKKYEKLKSGGKVKLLYLTPNIYNIKLIDFSHKYPDEFKKDFIPDYKLMFEKSVVSTITRVFDVINWDIRTPTMMETTDIFELFS